MPRVDLPLDPATVSRIIEMAWDDSTPFEAIQTQFKLDEAGVIDLMRRQLKRGSFRLWRERVRGRKAKHSVRAQRDMELVARVGNLGIARG